MKKKLYNNRFLIAGLILTIFFSVLFITFNLLRKDVAYIIEVKSNRNIVLSFDKKNKVIKVECEDNECNSKDNDKLLDLHYEELKDRLPKILDGDIKIRLVSGDKDISDLKSFFINNGSTNKDNTISDEEQNSDIEDNEESQKENHPNEENVQNNTQNNNSNPVQNNKPKDEVNNNASSVPKEEVTPLDITFMWIWGYSGHNVKFTNYSTVPMKYKNYGDATKFYSGDEHEGYVQLFDLKSQGITQNDACITFTYLDEDKNYPGPSSIVPIYTGGDVIYKKYCFGVEDIGYNKNYKEITGDALGDYTNIYEWKNNRWEYIGQFEDIEFNLPHYDDYNDTFYITELPGLSYGWVQREQRERFNEELITGVEEIDRLIDENRSNMATDPDWNKKDTQLHNARDELIELYNETTYLTWYDYSKLIEN